MRPVVLALLGLLALPALARAQDAQTVEDAARIWDTRWVYTAEGASGIGELDVDALEQRIGTSDATPLYVAIVPASATAGGSADELLAAMQDRSGRGGTFVVAVDGKLRAVTDRGFDAQHELDESVLRSPDSTQQALMVFVLRVEKVKGPEPEPSHWWRWLALPFVTFFVLATAYAVVLTVRRRRRVA